MRVEPDGGNRLSQVAHESGETLLDDMTKSKNSQRNNPGPTQQSQHLQPQQCWSHLQPSATQKTDTADNAGEDMEYQSPAMAKVVPVLAPSS